MVKLKTQEYIAKYSAEFPDGRINRELPFPTDTISVVSDPKNWHCYPENVVRIYLSNYDQQVWVVGVGDYQHPTICNRVFEELDDACSFIVNLPDAISKKWLVESGFDFLEPPVSKAKRIG
ncbi:MAG: hypothetical protein RMX63_13735 [Aulosira sp. ZfuCHP01]|nr:hypothetical protein [Aulosira sp. ZfuVER01]MDZ8000961.1 hypothetical protein [Aulosira sp. DedVER01a]MDZ8052514.1 hypothetical protein [Aulosira sp. ZfuCHP01]